MKNKDLKNKLSQLYDIRKEIIELQHKINKTKKKDNLTDVVESSARFFPFNKTHVKILGLNPDTAIKLEKYNEILEKRLINLLEIKAEIEQLISELPESRIRRIIEYKYMSDEEMSWTKVALKMGGNTTADSAKMEFHRFFKNI